MKRLENMRRIITLGAALLFVILGIWLMLQPLEVENLYPISLNDPMAVSEIRAVFGGLMLGIGLAVLLIDLICKRQRDAALVLAVVTFGLVTARVVGLFFEGIPSGAVRNETVFEVVLLILLIGTGAFKRTA